MSSHKSPHDFASEWKEAFNSHDLERFLALYSEEVVFKSCSHNSRGGERRAPGQTGGARLLAETIGGEA